MIPAYIAITFLLFLTCRAKAPGSTLVRACSRWCASLGAMRICKAEERALVSFHFQSELTAGFSAMEKSSSTFTYTWSNTFIFPFFSPPKCFSSHTSIDNTHSARPQTCQEVTLAACLCTLILLHYLMPLWEWTQTE